MGKLEHQDDYEPTEWSDVKSRREPSPSHPERALWQGRNRVCGTRTRRPNESLMGTSTDRVTLR
jgi:hypothetical protein